jgi:hypothetical protein
MCEATLKELDWLQREGFLLRESQIGALFGDNKASYLREAATDLQTRPAWKFSAPSPPAHALSSISQAAQPLISHAPIRRTPVLRLAAHVSGHALPADVTGGEAEDTSSHQQRYASTAGEFRSKARYVDCEEIMSCVRVAQEFPAVALRLTTGASCWLVRTKSYLALPEDLARTVCWRVQKALDDDCLAVYQFPSYEAAWSMLGDALQVGSVIYAGNGIHLKKQGPNHWLPTLMFFKDPHKTLEQLATFEPEFWHLLGVYELVGLANLDENVLAFFRFLANTVLWVTFREDDSCPSCKACDLRSHLWSDEGKLCAERWILSRVSASGKLSRFDNALCQLSMVVDRFYSRSRTSHESMHQVLEEAIKEEFPEGAKYFDRSFRERFRELFLKVPGTGADEDPVYRSWLSKSRRGLALGFVFSEKKLEAGRRFAELFPASSGNNQAASPKWGPYEQGMGLAPLNEMSQPRVVIGSPPPLTFVQPKLQTRHSSDLLYFIETAALDLPKDHAGPMSAWVCTVLSSPLSDARKFQMLHLCKRTSVVGTLECEGRAELVMAHALASACPLDRLRKVLVHAYPLPFAMQPFCQLKGAPDCYSIYFCSTHMLAKMLELKLPVQVLNLNTTSILSPDLLYLKIIGCFRGPVCFVFVRGLRLLDDLLFKWLAEFTKFVPYAYVYFEEVDSTFNYPENRDRALAHLWWRPSVTEWRLSTAATQSDINWIEFPSIQHRLQGVPRGSYVDMLWPMPAAGRSRWLHSCRSGFNGGNWYEELKLEFMRGIPPGGAANEASYKHWVLLLESPPGAGKTHRIKELGPWLRDHQVCVRNVDCSDDRLVNSPLLQLLDASVPAGCNKVLLVRPCLRVVCMCVSLCWYGLVAHASELRRFAMNTIFFPSSIGALFLGGSRIGSRRRFSCSSQIAQRTKT